MSRVFAFRRRVLVAACAAVLFLGCGPRGVKVEGKILNNGQPYTPPQGGKLSLSLTGGEGDNKETYAATINPDGSFVVPGMKGGGVPPGKYTVSMNLAPESTDPDSLDQMSQASDLFTAVNGKECEITGDAGKPITIDVGKGTVTR